MSIEQEIRKHLTEATAMGDVARYDRHRQHHHDKAAHHRMLAQFHDKATEIKGQDAGVHKSTREHHNHRARQHEDLYQLLSDLMHHIEPNPSPPKPIRTVHEEKLAKGPKKALKAKYKAAKKGSGPIPGTGGEAYES